MDKAQMYKIIDKTSGKILASRAAKAVTTYENMKGLLGRKSLESSEALILQTPGSIHTFFMQFSLDLLFLDSTNTVLKVCHKIPPWRLIFAPFGSAKVVELPAGVLSLTNTLKGAKISIEAVQS